MVRSKRLILALAAGAIILFLFTTRPLKAGGEDEFPVALIGLDRAGQEVASTVPASVFTDSLALAFSAIHRAALPSLAAHREPATTEATWRLRALGVGVGLNGNFGLGPIVSVSASPRLILVFTNSSQPSFPR
jgi:hypothetical protein